MATSTLGNGTLVLAGTTSGTTTVTATAVAGTTTLTLPAATDTLVGRATTDTLTNKTLTGAAMNGTLGATTPSTGAFTTLTSTGASSFATSSGDVGIGTSSPNSKLQVNSGTNLGGVLIGFNGGSSNFYDADAQYWRTGNGTERMRLDSSGNLLVGQTSAGARVDVLSGSNQTAFSGYVNVASSTSTPALYLAKYDNDTTTSQVYVRFAYNQNTFTGGQINGNGANQAAFGSWSDRRLKENIVDLPPQLDKIMALRPVEFDYLQSIGGGHQIGFIAQELQTIYEDSVGDDGSEEKHLSITGWSKTEARLVKAIQEQQALITQLTARITALEGA